jgi:lipid II:glycine glycyltransferase (peptidoglycan interpeptide bridge formation enzyme)
MLDKDRNLVCTAESLQALRDSYLRCKVDVLRIMPNIIDDATGIQVLDIMKKSRFCRVNTTAPYHTFIVSLLHSEDEIRQRIHRDCRRILRKSEKNDIKVSEAASDEYFAILEELYAGSKGRKGFKGIDAEVFRLTQQKLPPDQKIRILIAWCKNQPITAHATSHFGDTAIPVITASNKEGLKSGTSYLLWWKAYLAAKKLGMKFYDLGGIDEKVNPRGFLFKKRMAGEEAYYIGTFDACSNAWVRFVWLCLERIYNCIRK